MPKRSRPALLLLSLTLAILVGADGRGCGRKTHYSASVQRTTYGIPHIQARDYGGLGYGYGFAFAQDNFCVLAREMVEANGNLSLYFGPGGGNLEKDLFYTFWSSDEVVERFFGLIGEDLQELAKGYAAGYNRYLRDTGVENLPEACRDAEWVREIDEIDLFRFYYKLVDRAGASNLINQIVAAVPPPGALAQRDSPAPANTPANREPLAPAAEPLWAQMTPEEFRAQVDLPVWNPAEIGSNMVALGSDATEDGRGMLLVNPHFPWSGALRFYQVHLTIPGVIDSMGASLFGSPLPNIAFNKDVAWSHTVSAAERFVLRELRIVPGDPFSYQIDGETRPLRSTEVTVEVLEADGTIGTRSHTFWESEFGPLLAIPPIVVWNDFFALSIEDVNRDNFRIFNQYLRMNLARNMDEFVAAVEEEVGLPWVNTAAVDRHGEAYYGDIGTVPNLSAQKLEDCSTPLTAFIAGFGLTSVNGFDADCALSTDPDSPQAGIFGASNLPKLRSRDWVQNSNDSYWLTRPDTPLEGFSPLLGGERNQQGLRTRLGIRQIEERLAGTDGLPGDRFDQAAVQNLVTGNRNLSAELMVPGVLTLCDEEDPLVDTGGEIVDVGEACDLLGTWDRRMDTDSVGALVWRFVWPRIDDIENLYVFSFDENDAANTPRDLNLADVAVRGEVMAGLADAVVSLAANGLAIDAPWGDVHFDEKNGVEIPIPGGPGGHGVYNAIGAGFQPGRGYTPIGGGSSIVMAVSFGRRHPEVKGLLTYSQSTDPTSPHYSDQTMLFSEEGWTIFPSVRETSDATGSPRSD